MPNSNVSIVITGSQHSGKGTVAATIARVLREVGATVVLQGEGTFNKDKIEKDQEALHERLKSCKITITEQQTSLQHSVILFRIKVGNCQPIRAQCIGSTARPAITGDLRNH